MVDSAQFTASAHQLSIISALMVGTQDSCFFYYPLEKMFSNAISFSSRDQIGSGWLFLYGMCMLAMLFWSNQANETQSHTVFTTAHQHECEAVCNQLDQPERSEVLLCERERKLLNISILYSKQCGDIHSCNGRAALVPNFQCSTELFSCVFLCVCIKIYTILICLYKNNIYPASEIRRAKMCLTWIFIIPSILFCVIKLQTILNFIMILWLNMRDKNDWNDNMDCNYSTREFWHIYS